MISNLQNSGKSELSWTYLTNETPTKQHLNRIKSDSDLPDLDPVFEQQMKRIGMVRNTERKCREETFFETNVRSWGDAVNQLKRYIDDKEGLNHVLENKDSGEKIYIENNHRFEESYKKKQMAKFYSIESKALENYGKENLKTVMITLSASPLLEDGRFKAPIDHLDSIMDRDRGSWNAVKSAMSRVLSDYDYEYMRILEPHTNDKGKYWTSGYAHMHLGILVNDPKDEIEDKDFEKVMSAHIDNCETAGRSAHKVKSDSVSVTKYDEDEEGGVGAYLTSYMGDTIEGEFEEQDEYFKRFLATLWLSNRRRVGFSQGAQKWAKEDYKEKYEKEENDEVEPKTYEYWGIAKPDEEGELEEYEVNNQGHSGSYLEKMPNQGYMNDIEVTTFHCYDPPD